MPKYEWPACLQNRREKMLLATNWLATKQKGSVSGRELASEVLRLDLIYLKSLKSGKTFLNC